jgi:hypothetical protein
LPTATDAAEAIDNVTAIYAIDLDQGGNASIAKNDL